MKKTLLLIISFHLAISSSCYPGISVNHGFIENKGQIMDQNGRPNPLVKYLFNSPGLKVQIRENGFSYDILSTGKAGLRVSSSDEPGSVDSSLIYCHRIDFTFLEFNPGFSMETSSPSLEYYNYYTPGCGLNGVLNVHQYQTVIFKNLYKNIDLHFTVDPETGFKYNYVIRPGGDINQIKFRIDGAPARSDEITGSIVIHTEFGDLSEEIPLSYSDQISGKKPVTILFRKIDSRTFGLSGNIDSPSSYPIIIDPIPTRRWGTYFGGSLSEYVWSRSSAIDNQQNLIAGGTTSSTNNIATTGAFLTTLQGGDDAFLAKLTPSGSLLWATYFGGPGAESLSSVDTDHDRYIYLCGNTSSSFNIATPGAYQTNLSGSEDAYLAKFTPGGQRVWSTYFGGLAAEPVAICCVGPTGIFISGHTGSTTGIATPGSCQPVHGGGSADCYLAKFSSSGNRLWGTYYGGENLDEGGSCVVDNSGNVFLCGDTWSTTNIATPGAFDQSLSGLEDGFLVSFDDNGIRRWGTYYGGEGEDVLIDVCADSTGNCFFLGHTSSSTGIATPGAYQNSLITGSSLCIGEFDSTGQRIWGSYYGAGSPAGSNCSLNPDNSAFYITGSSPNVPSVSLLVSPNAYQTTYGGGTSDGFFAKFTADGQRVWGSLFGGDGMDGNLNIVSNSGNIFYLTGTTRSVNNIATQNTLNPVFQGVQDAFIVKFADCAPPDTANQIFVPASICEYSDSLLFYIDSIPQATYYLWTLSSGFTLVSGQGNDSILVNTLSRGAFESVTVKGVNDCGEGNEKTLLVPITPRPQNISITGSDSICTGVSSVFSTDPGMSDYQWNISPGSQIISGGTSSDSQVQVEWIVPGSQWAEVNYSDSNGCNALTAAHFPVTVTPGDSLKVSIIASDNNVCAGTPVIFTAAPTGSGTLTYQWKVNGLNQGTNNPVFAYSPMNNDMVTCVLTSSVTACVTNNPAISNSISMVVIPVSTLAVTISASENPSCSGNPVTFTATPSVTGPTHVFTWQVNGVPVGGNQISFSYIPADNDLITCTLSSSEPCLSPNFVTSAPVQMIVYQNLIVSVGITASSNPVCSGIPVTFTAIPVNGGLMPAYQWMVNGVNAGANQSTYTYAPVDGDLVACSMTTSITSCVNPLTAIADPITMMISPSPVVSYTLCTDSVTTTQAKPIRLKGGIPHGGVYSGPGVNSSTGVFDPSIAGPGTKAITYSYTNAGSCAASQTKNILVRAPAAFTCGNPYTDIRDQEVYQTIQLGVQCWFAENLRYGTVISQSMHQRDNCIPEKYCISASCQPPASGLYQWEEIMQYSATPGEQGLCPPSWHVPAEPEWQILFNFYSGTAFAAAPLKSSGFSGFNASPLGVSHQNSGFNYAGFATFFWTSTPHGGHKAWSHGMNETDPSSSTYPANRQNGFSVRCLKD